MRTLLRSVVSLAVFLCVDVLAFYLSGPLLLEGLPPEGRRTLARIIAFPCAIGAKWFVWTGTGENPKLLPSVIGGIFLGGIVGFLVGFVGPLVSEPQASAGPLLSLLTGPLGALIGGFAGITYWRKG